MIMSLIKSKKILIIAPVRGGASTYFNILRKIFKEELIENIMRQWCIKLETINELPRKKNGQQMGSWLYPNIINSINKISIDEIKKYKIMLILKNPYIRLLNFYLQRFVTTNRFNSILTFEQFVNKFYKYWKLNNNSFSKTKTYPIYDDLTFQFHTFPQCNIKKNILFCHEAYYNHCWIREELINYLSDLYNKKIEGNFKVIDSSEINVFEKYLDLKINTYNDQKFNLENCEYTLYNYSPDKLKKKFKNIKNFEFVHKNYIPLKGFFSDEIKKKIHEIYKDDFRISELHGFNYTI